MAKQEIAWAEPAGPPLVSPAGTVGAIPGGNAGTAGTGTATLFAGS